LPQNATLNISYILGAGHTGISCLFNVGKTMTDFTTLVNISCPENKQESYLLNLEGLAPGGYYVQWVWVEAGSNWYSCFQIAITDPNLRVTALTYSGTDTFTGVALDTTPVNYNISLPPILTDGSVNANGVLRTGNNIQYLLININNSIDSISHLNATVSGSFIPSTYMDGTYVTVAPGTSKYLYLCSIRSSNVYLTLFSEIVGNYSYSIANTLYDSWLDWNGKRDQAIALEGAGVLVYWTKATSTFDVPKKIIIEGRGGNAYLMTTTTCTSDLNQPLTTTMCVDAASDIQNGNNAAAGRTQYYYVVTDASWYGKISLEPGLCSGASTVIVSLTLALIVLLF